MNICTRCANRLETGAVICTRCGNRVIQPVIGKQTSRDKKTINKLPIIIAVCALIVIGILAFTLAQNSADNYLLKNIPRTIKRFIVNDEICEFEAKELTILYEGSESGYEIYDTEVIFEDSNFSLKRYLRFTCKKSMFDLEMVGDPVDYKIGVVLPKDDYAQERCKQIMSETGIVGVESMSVDASENNVVVICNVNQNSKFADITGVIRYNMTGYYFLNKKGILEVSIPSEYDEREVVENSCSVNWKAKNIVGGWVAEELRNENLHWWDFLELNSNGNSRMEYKYSSHDDYCEHEDYAEGSCNLENKIVYSHGKMGTFLKLDTKRLSVSVLIGYDSIELFVSNPGWWNSTATFSRGDYE